MLTTKTAAPVAANKRFTLAPVSETTSEGTVALGVDRNERVFLVHSVGRQTEAISAEAVAVAIGGGKVFTPEDIVAVYTETGKLGKLADAVAKAQG